MVPDPDFLAALRSHTSSWHDRLEQRVDIARRLASPGAYVGLLSALFGLYEPLERALAELALPAGFDLPARRKVPLLVADLGRFGVAPGDLPRCAALPPMATAPQAAGVLYVMEGATLGGQVIGRALAQDLRLEAGTGAGFFAGYGERTGTMWTQFRRNLAILADTAERQSQVMQAAAATFAVFDHWIAHCDTMQRNVDGGARVSAL